MTKDSQIPFHLDRNRRAQPARGMNQVRRASQRSMEASPKKCLPEPADIDDTA